jgi:hypothetical protein
VILQSFDVTSTKLVFVIVLAELAIYLVVGARGVKMLMDVFSPHAVRRPGKLIFGDTLQPAVRLTSSTTHTTLICRTYEWSSRAWTPI